MAIESTDDLYDAALQGALELLKMRLRNINLLIAMLEAEMAMHADMSFSRPIDAQSNQPEQEN